MRTTTCVSSLMRIALVMFLVACASGRPPPVPPPTPLRLVMQPVRVHGGEGYHSSSQSWATYTGALEQLSGRNTVHLTLTTERSYIGCPTVGPFANDGGNGMQACYKDPPPPQTATATRTLSDVPCVARGAAIECTVQGYPALVFQR